MDEREYIIENITKEEWEILEDNGIDWCPDDMFGTNQDAIIFGEDEYNKAMELLGRKQKQESMTETEGMIWILKIYQKNILIMELNG